MAMVICPNCHKETPDDQNVCIHCESLLQTDFSKEMADYSHSVYKDGVLVTLKCPHCGEYYNDGDSTCSKCGKPIEEQ